MKITVWIFECLLEPDITGGREKAHPPWSSQAGNTLTPGQVCLKYLVYNENISGTNIMKKWVLSWSIHQLIKQENSWQYFVPLTYSRPMRYANTWTNQPHENIYLNILIYSVFVNHWYSSVIPALLLFVSLAGAVTVVWGTQFSVH